MSWEEKPLGEIVNLKRGYDLPSRLRTKGTVPIVSSSGVTDYHNKSKYIGEGVITGRYGTLGQVFYVNGEYWPLNTTLYVQDFKGNYPRYIYYYLKLLELEQYNGAAAVPGLDRNVLHKIKCILPPLPIQKKIASILSAYDDLIENNLKRIKLLEEAAQNIYKEWFVNFRFPGWQNAKFDEETGLPEGWRITTIGESCHLVMGQSPQSEFYNEKGDGLPFHQGVTGYGQRFVKHSTYCTKQTRIANEGDILCSVRAPVGRLNISPEKIIIGRGLSAIRNKNGFQSFQFCQLKNHFFQEDMIGGGAIFNSVTKKDLESQKLVEPAKLIIAEFEKIVKPIDFQISNLDKQNQKLKEARDILLPRLMNQSIEV